MKKLVSPIPYVGSKRQLRDEIIKRIPKHTCYVEPFAGAAWVYLGKEPSEVEVLNDINGNLIALYRVIKDKPQEFQDALWYMFPSRDLYYESTAILKSDERIAKLTDVERAVIFYYHLKNAFGGRFGSGFGFSKSRPPRQAIAQELVVALRERLQRTFIENISYERVVRSYDAADTFFYLDPPYLMTGKDKCYQFEFSTEDHERLAVLLKAVAGKFMLSYGDHPTIRKAYKSFKIELTDPVTYTLSGTAKQKRELLISNY